MANNDASFSLSSETARELEVFFDGAMEETKEKVLNVFSELARINSEAKYNIVRDAVIELAQHFSGDFRSQILQMFDQWYDDEESVHAFILDNEAAADDDDGSMTTAYQLEDCMRESLDSVFSTEPEVYTDSAPVALTEYGGANKLFEDISSLLAQFDSEMEDIIDGVEKEADSKGDDNQIYINVVAILTNLLKAFQSLFQAFETGISDHLSSHVSEKNQISMSKVEDSKQVLESDAEQAGEKLKDIAPLFHY